MRSFFRIAFFSRNVPTAERILRLGTALALAALPFLHSFAPMWASALWVSAAFVAATGFLGFCPACYLAGRGLLPRNHER